MPSVPQSCDDDAQISQRNVSHSSSRRQDQIVAQVHSPFSHDRLADPPLVETTPGVFENADRYQMIESDGLPGANAPLQPGWVYINKQTPATTTGPNEPGRITWKNAPMSNKYPLRTYVDKVLISHTETETQLIKVLLRQTRRPELGDKFSSRHGQKGVCGLIVPQADMPFNDQGICRESPLLLCCQLGFRSLIFGTADIIMNPHGFPSRMYVHVALPCPVD